MSKHYIPVRHVEGQTGRQAHCDLPSGSYERELGKEGFFGPATHMYHPRPPTGWTGFDGPLSPRAYDANKLSASNGSSASTPGSSPWQATELLSNAHCRVRFWQAAESMQQLARNADGDELLFLHSGNAELYCDYGHLSLRQGDYLMLPRSTMWRLEHSQPIQALLIEATNSSYMLPDKGLVGPHAIFDPARLDVPALNTNFKAQQDVATDVVVKRQQQLTTIHYPHNPLDAIGWHGDLMPVRINWRDIRPLMSHRYHLPPSAHATFIANRIVVCTFVPRPFETDPGAIKVPFFHNNDDFDEVIFYHAGEFFSRDNIHPGMLTWHPCGFTHGPHPQALNNMLEQKAPGTNEVAVMLDTRDALTASAEAEAVEWREYAASWQRPQQ